jgi:hypothetical protein
MNYERKMLEDLMMPRRKEVEQALLKSLFNNNGAIKEFSAGEKIVDEIADEFDLNEQQRTAYLKTVYKKEDRVKRSYLWHRLLFRAADALAKAKLITRPTQTMVITNKKEWMLTEEGYSRVLEILNIPIVQKEFLPIKSYEVQKIVQKICRQERLEDYSPFLVKESVRITQNTKLRNRAFRQAVREVYDYRCAVCGMKIFSPDKLQWEIEAAHIVPHSANGKDDILNGLALCRLHHWAFDVGWFTLEDDFKILASKGIKDLPDGFGMLGNYDFKRHLLKENLMISLPKERDVYPHPNAIKWHRENVFRR